MPLGSLLFMHTPFVTELNKFDEVTHIGRGLVFRGSATSPPKGAGSQ